MNYQLEARLKGEVPHGRAVETQNIEKPPKGSLLRETGKNQDTTTKPTREKKFVDLGDGKPKKGESGGSCKKKKGSNEGGKDQPGDRRGTNGKRKRTNNEKN